MTYMKVITVMWKRQNGGKFLHYLLFYGTARRRLGMIAKLSYISRKDGRTEFLLIAAI
jgi:hypothetical protein